jgi:hypothetical protein
MTSQPSTPLSGKLSPSSVLNHFDTFNRELLTLFNQELPTLRLRDAGEKVYAFSRVTMLGHYFEFTLAPNEYHHEELAPARLVTPWELTPMIQLLELSLSRIYIFDDETDHPPLTLSEVESVKGGYNLITKEELER